MVLSPDLQTRRSWTTFNGSTGGGAQGVRIAVGSENAAVLLRQTDEDGALGPQKALLLQDSWVSAPAGSSDDYLAVFRLPE